MLDDVKKVPGKSEHLDDAISISSFMPKNTESFFRPVTLVNVRWSTFQPSGHPTVY
ncbi:hypothetical protein CBL_20771 [Carabus blaptoides fortunei]